MNWSDIEAATDEAAVKCGYLYGWATYTEAFFYHARSQPNREIIGDWLTKLANIWGAHRKAKRLKALLMQKQGETDAMKYGNVDWYVDFHRMLDWMAARTSPPSKDKRGQLMFHFMKGEAQS